MTTCSTQRLFCKQFEKILITTKNKLVIRRFSSFRATQVKSSFSGILISKRTMSDTNIFNLNLYQCIGFDLDNTMLRYKVYPMMELIYDSLAEYLCSHKNYSKKYLLKPMKEDLDFIQKGLILDCDRGNVLRICPDGFIQIASHGTKFLSASEIEKCYGAKRHWETTDEYAKCPLVAWNGELSQKIRTTLDYFDMPAALIFARIVDSLDKENGGKQPKYNVWPDILEALVAIYSREHFESGTSAYFENMKAHPEKYIHKTSDSTLNWLKMLKEKKTTFLLTGSYIDFANFTASYALGSDWKKYFDTIICFAKKPGFFTMKRPFLELDGFKESDPVVGDLKDNCVYSQGNIGQLREFFSKLTKTKDMKLVYVGDSLIQDVYTPHKYSDLDTIAIVEEMYAEGPDYDSEFEILRSNAWGSYFHHKKDPTLWSEIIKKHSKICVPTVDEIAKNPLDHDYKAFSKMDSSSGYYPHDPNF
jgi:HAD superfamily 5'-nucleotidase-like hydrolase